MEEPLIVRAYNVRDDGTRELVWEREIVAVVPAPVVATPDNGVDVYEPIIFGPGPFPYGLRGKDDDDAQG